MKCVFHFVVPVDLDVKAKATLLGALFLIVSDLAITLRVHNIVTLYLHRFRISCSLSSNEVEHKICIIYDPAWFMIIIHRLLSSTLYLYIPPNTKTPIGERTLYWIMASQGANTIIRYNIPPFGINSNFE